MPGLQAALIANDTFNRANQSGWGNATDNQSWVQNPGTLTLSIASNEGKATGNTTAAVFLLGSQKCADAHAIIRCSFTTSGVVSYALVLRATATNTFYMARFGNAANTIDLAKMVSGTISSLVSTAFTPAQSFFWVRFMLRGSSLSGKWWLDGSAEPASWTLTTTDAGITGVGQVGTRIKFNTATDSTQMDNFKVYSLDTIGGRLLTPVMQVGGVS